MNRIINKNKAILSCFIQKAVEGIYCDSPLNRKLGRVGMSYSGYNDYINRKNDGEEIDLKDYNNKDILKKNEALLKHKLKNIETFHNSNIQLNDKHKISIEYSNSKGYKASILDKNYNIVDEFSSTKKDNFIQNLNSYLYECDFIIENKDIKINNENDYKEGKSIKDCEEIAKSLSFINEVNYSHCTIKQANSLNRILFDFYKRNIIIPNEYFKNKVRDFKLDTYVVKSKNEAYGSYTPFNPNSVLKIATNFDTIENRKKQTHVDFYIKQQETSIKNLNQNEKFYKDRLDDLDYRKETGQLTQDDLNRIKLYQNYLNEITKLKKDVENKIKDAKENSFNGLLNEIFAKDFNSSITATSMEECLIHELGHYINVDIYSESLTTNGKKALKNLIKRADNLTLNENEIEKQHIYNPRHHFLDNLSYDLGKNISNYATFSGSECFAEAFTAKYKGQKLDDKDLDMLMEAIINHK